jgi:hypothetical protein
MPEVTSSHAEENHDSFRITSKQPEIRTECLPNFRSDLLSLHYLAQKEGMEECAKDGNV